MANGPTSPVERVREFLRQFPFGIEVYEYDVTTKTAELAAQAVGVEVGQIAKSVLLKVGERPVMIVTSGDMRVNQSKLKQHLGWSGKVKLPSPEETIALTGYLPGGVCPFALPQPLPILIDVSLQRFAVVYIAAGAANTAAPVTVEQLLVLTGGELCDVCLPAGN